ncbi:MAG: amino acid permease, partial [Vicinamibacterales bacterium]
MTEGRPKRVLSLFDTTSLIVGIIVGAGVFVAAPEVARAAGSGPALLALWLAGGLLSLCGALGYAELASAYPEAGGDYVYLTRAYGRWAGFLFGWIQTLVVRPGDIAVMAFVFATYAERLLEQPWAGRPALAAAAVVVLTAVNALGVRSGVWTQNALTVVKLIGVSLIVVVPFAASVHPPTAGAFPTTTDPLPLAVAVILVLFSFGGWNEMVYVAAEVRHPTRNIVRAMALGMGVVTVIYLALNTAFLRVLTLPGLRSSSAVATDTVARALPQHAGSLVSALIALCALGAVNGLVFAGARISYAVGRDHRLFRSLGRWSRHAGTPLRAMIVQGALSLTLIFALGSFLDAVMYTAAAVYLFYLATSAAVLVLRLREPGVPRPYRAFGYPATTIVFCAVCVFLIVAAVQYRPWIAAG